MPILEAGLESLVREGLEGGRLRFVVGRRERGGRTPSSSTCACRRPRATTARPTCPTSRRRPARSARCSRPRRSWSTSRPCRSARPGSVEQALGRDDVVVVSNPEFLREGSAVHDFLNPDRIVIGSDDQAAAVRVAALYLGVDGAAHRHRPGVGRDDQVRVATPSSPPRSPSSTPSPPCARRSAPTSTTSCSAWATTSASATSSSSPGPGWGGCCFPKDSRALVHIAEDAGYDFDLLEGVITVNDEQFERIVDKVAPHGRRLARRRRRSAVWGLTFKARTDDLRDSPALAIVGRSPRQGAEVRAYDPAVKRAGRRLDGIESRRPVRRVRRAPTCSSCSPSGTSSAGSTSTRSPGSWRHAGSSTPATCSTAPALAPARASSYAGHRRADVARGSSSPAGPGSSARTSARRCSAGATRSSPSTTCSPGRSTTSSTCSAGRGFTFVEHDVSQYVWVPGAVDAVLHFASPASPGRLRAHADPDPQGRQPRHPQLPRPGQGQGRPVLPGVDQRGLRRPAGAPPARDVLGQRQPDRARAASTTRPSASPRR